jgi:hypothetical protein
MAAPWGKRLRSELTAGGLGEPREAMGPTAVSRFLYERRIANKIRKSSESLAKAGAPRVALSSERGNPGLKWGLSGSGWNDFRRKLFWRLIRQKPYVEVGQIFIKDVGIQHKKRDCGLNDHCDHHFEECADLRWWCK